jgi:hypothetical protein
VRHPGTTGSDLAAPEQRRQHLLDAAQFTSRPWDFDRASWIADVQRAADRVRGCASAVAPFGFEPLFAGSPLTISPKRFYVYTTADNDAARVEREVAREIVGCILPDTRIVVTTSDTTVRADGRRGSLYVRTIGPGHQSALTLYARYLAALPRLAVDGQLREARDYARRPSARRYLLHTTIALALLYLEVAPPGPDHVRLMADLARDQADRDPATGAPPEVAAHAGELAVLDDVILPYLGALAGWLTETDPRPIPVVDVHSGVQTRVYANEDRLETVAARIEAHYRPTPSPA